MNPYYTTSELINNALNMGITKVGNINLKQIYGLCRKIKTNDFDIKILFNHEIFIRENQAKYIIEYYSLFGSIYINNYLRKKEKLVEDFFIEKMITILWKLIKNAPQFYNCYYVYRFIDNDSYIENLIPNDIYISNSFTSTSRNPFYSPINNYFGNILIKIKLPKNIQGVALCMENYSFFHNEYEILLPPCSLKLISKDDNFKYYHPNKDAQNNIKKKYEFEYINSNDVNPLESIKIKKKILNIPNLNINNLNKIKKSIFYEEFLNDFNGMKPFYLIYNKNKILLHTYYYNKSVIYDNFFYNKNDFFYIIYHDINNCKINLLIEISDILSVNYHQKFNGQTSFIDGKMLLDIISKFGYIFRCKNIIIHGNYDNYYDTIKTKFDTKDQLEFLTYENIDSHMLNLYSASTTYYCIDIYKMILNEYYDKDILQDKRFDNNNIEIIFDFEIIKKLKKLQIDKLNIPKQHIITKLYIKNNFNNILEFYIYLHNNYFYLIENIEHYILKYFNLKYNIFQNITYKFNYTYYLYNYDQNDIYFDLYIEIKIYENLGINLDKYGIEYNKRQINMRRENITIN